MGPQILYVNTFYTLCLIAFEPKKCIYVAGFHEWLQYDVDQNKNVVPVEWNMYFLDNR